MIWPEIHSFRSFRQTHWNNIYWFHILAAGQWKLCLMWRWRLYPCLKVVNGFHLGKGGKEAESLSKGEFSNMALPHMNTPSGSPPFLTWMNTDKSQRAPDVDKMNHFSTLSLLLCHVGKSPYNSYIIHYFFEIEVGDSCFSEFSPIAAHKSMNPCKIFQMTFR